MKYCENECTPQEPHIYRGLLTSSHKKYCRPIIVGLRGIGAELVTDKYKEDYSDFKLFTGFVTAAFIAWKLIVKKVITIAVKAAIINTHGPILMRYSYFCNQLCKK